LKSFNYKTHTVNSYYSACWLDLANAATTGVRLPKTLECLPPHKRGFFPISPELLEEAI
jgi:hypothetical protein